MEATMHIAEKYMVLIALVRHLATGNDYNEIKVRKALALPTFREEPFEYCGLYSRLIDSIVHGKSLDFINTFIDSTTDENVYHDIDQVNNFHELSSCENDREYLLIMLEGQLIDLAHHKSGLYYEFHTEQSNRYMLENDILLDVVLYKSHGVVIRESMFFLDTSRIFTLDIERMRRKAYHI